MEPIHKDVLSSPIIISQVHNPYERRYTDEQLDEYREEYSESFVEQPPPLYLHLLDSVEDLQTSQYQTNVIRKEIDSSSLLLQKKEEVDDYCFSFWHTMHRICCFFCY